MAGGRAACPGCGQEFMEGTSRCLRCDYYDDRKRWDARPVPPRRPRPPAPPKPKPDPMEEILGLRRNLEAKTEVLAAAKALRVPPRAAAPPKPVKKYRKRRKAPKSNRADVRRPATLAERQRSVLRIATAVRLGAESRFLDQRNEAADRYFLRVLERVAPAPDTDPDNWPLVVGYVGRRK